jgi:hypothetical protein
MQILQPDMSYYPRTQDILYGVYEVGYSAEPITMELVYMLHTCKQLIYTENIIDAYVHK